MLNDFDCAVADVASTKAKVSVHPQPVGAFAVMRHHSGAKKMHLCMIHPTRQSAEEEAQRLFVKSTEDPDARGLGGFYILEIVGRLGVFNGKFEG